ncbi:unnamed protein product [Echinostoma caproni]|uniref:Integrase catalytic domain-containing protein n=1 Tax=Echinostoma caproni TaxID=27848 RepID=A0A183AVL9_9TREM|nr:unnamed protein product [Echinostoma caproni]
MTEQFPEVFQDGVELCTRVQASLQLVPDAQPVFRHTQDFSQADGLSRLPQNQTSTPEYMVISAITSDADTRRALNDAIRGTPVTVEDIKHASANAPNVQSAMSWTVYGWPPTMTSNKLKQFHMRRASLSLVDSCLMFANRVVIPSSLSSRLLHQFHATHLGISRMKCQQAAKFPAKEQPIAWPAPTGPWDRRVLAKHDLPEVIVLNNGTQFTSTVFRDFCQRRHIQHIRIPP